MVVFNTWALLDCVNLSGAPWSPTSQQAPPLVSSVTEWTVATWTSWCPTGKSSWPCARWRFTDRAWIKRHKRRRNRRAVIGQSSTVLISYHKTLWKLLSRPLFTSYVQLPESSRLDYLRFLPSQGFLPLHRCNYITINPLFYRFFFPQSTLKVHMGFLLTQVWKSVDILV